MYRSSALFIFVAVACAGTGTSPSTQELQIANAAASGKPPPSETPPPATPIELPPSASAYSGHGIDSIATETLERFAPKAPPPAIATHVQQMIELFGPSPGALTPDAKRLVFSWRVSGQAQIWRIDGMKRFPVQLTSGEDRTALAAITPDGKRLVVARDKNGEENPGIYVMSIAGGPLTTIQHLKGVQTRFHQLSRDGGTMYFSANDKTKDSYTVYSYDMKTGERRVRVDTPGLWSVSDVRDDGTLLLRKAIGSLPSEYYEMSPAGELTPLFGIGENVEYEAAYGATPGEILVQTPKLGEFRRLYTWNAKDRTLQPLSAETPHDVASFVIDEDKKRLVYHVNDDGYTHVFTMVWHGGKWHGETTPFIPKADHVVIGSLMRGGRYATASIDYGDRPPTTLVIDFVARKAESWQEPSTPELDTSKFARATLQSFPARDGTPIPAFVQRPKDCDGSKLCPVIVNLHGGPEGQYVGGFNGGAQLFVDDGFIYVAPNVRGSDGYGKTWLAADDGTKRLQIITDIEDAATWARMTFAVGGQAPKVGIYGGSYGGYSALVGMTMFAGAYDAGVSVVGIANLVTFLNNTAPYRRVLRISEYGDPEKDREALEKLSPTTYIDKVRSPLLLLQGATDPRVPVGEALAMHEALSKKGVPNELMIFPDEGHGASKRANRVIMTGNALRFFDQYLK